MKIVDLSRRCGNPECAHSLYNHLWPTLDGPRQGACDRAYCGCGAFVEGPAP